MFRPGGEAGGGGWFDFGDTDDPPLTPAQIAAVGRLIAEQAAVGQAIPRGVSVVLPAIQTMFSAAGWDVRLPEPGCPELGTSIAVSGVIVHDIPGGDAVLGVVLECDRDAEHGLGVLLRRTEVLGVGGADADILGWVARSAAGGECERCGFYGSRPDRPGLARTATRSNRVSNGAQAPRVGKDKPRGPASSVRRAGPRRLTDLARHGGDAAAPVAGQRL